MSCSHSAVSCNFGVGCAARRVWVWRDWMGGLIKQTRTYWMGERIDHTRTHTYICINACIKIRTYIPTHLLQPGVEPVAVLSDLVVHQLVEHRPVCVRARVIRIDQWTKSMCNQPTKQARTPCA